VKVDEANVPGNPADGPLAAEAINRVLDAVRGGKAVHFCFGNYGGQSIQRGTWKALVGFLNSLRADHLVLELAHRPASDLEALREVDPRPPGHGVVEHQGETASKRRKKSPAPSSARRPRLWAGRIRYVHPDCGFWMLKRSVADRKIAALARGRDLYLGETPG
jgi:5-methyltetrahydropteroyltriglutamate--homocysteine methyltransferase